MSSGTVASASSMVERPSFTLINKELETAELKKIAVRGGMKTLHQDSLIKVKDGLSTMEEALATVPEDMQ
jgi:type IV pilus assembly protein PilB